MTSSTATPDTPAGIPQPWRWVLAGCVVTGMTATVVAVLTNPPYYGSHGGVAAAISTNATHGDLMDRTHVLAEVVASYLLPVGFLAMAWLAAHRARRLATLAAIVAFLGLSPLAVFAGEDSLYYDIARTGASPALVDMAQHFNSDTVMTYYNLMFVTGTVIAPILLGTALWRAAIIPAWAAILLIFGRLPVLLFPVLPYRVLIILLLIGFLTLLIGSLPAAAALTRTDPRAARGGPGAPGTDHDRPG
jgi:hypothetical protein